MTLKSPNVLPLLALVLTALFIFTVGIAVNYTFIDEVYFADPVINYLRGHGYTTTVWNVTRQFETHVSSAPAYSLLLLLWLKVFGVSQTAVRTLPPVLALASVLVFWRACLRSGLIKSGPAGAVLICLLLLDYGYAFSYTCGRPDSLTALLVAAMFYCHTLPNQRAALLVMGGLALLLPFVQWGCVLYLFFLAIALFLIARQQTLPFLVVVCGCLAAGLLAQKMIYLHLDLWNTWVNTVKSEGSEKLAQRISARLSLVGLLHRSSNTFPKDFSVMVLLAGLAGVGLRNQLLHRSHGVRLARSGWLIATVVVLGMYFVGKFPTYYGWMLGFPLAALLCSFIDQTPPVGRLDFAIVMAVTALACAVGLPLQAALASRDWKQRNPAAVRAWLGPKINTNDVVYCDYPFYFMARERARLVFAGRYASLLDRADFRRITVVIVGKTGSDWAQTRQNLTSASAVGNWQAPQPDPLGNTWKYGVLSAPNYDCTVYRLKPPP